MITIQNVKILFDPYITGNPLAKSIDITDIKADYILLSHGHADHVADVEKVYSNQSATVIGLPEVVHWFQKKDINHIHAMNVGGESYFPFGTLKIVKEVHSSAMPDGSYGDIAIGFIIESEGKTIYFAGDTALHQDMKLIGEHYAIDYALLPIGGTYTMGVKDALIAADYVGAKKVIGMHYDTFPIITIDKEKTKKLAIKQKKELILMGINTSIEC